MHTDEEKKYEKRTIEANLRQGMISHQEMEEYLAKLPDVRHKALCWEQKVQGSLKMNNEKLETFTRRRLA